MVNGIKVYKTTKEALCNPRLFDSLCQCQCGAIWWLNSSQNCPVCGNSRYNLLGEGETGDTGGQRE